jgi:hypothetical protein
MIPESAIELAPGENGRASRGWLRGLWRAARRT